MNKKRRYRKSLIFTKGLRDKLKQGMSKELKKEIDEIYEKYVAKPKRRSEQRGSGFIDHGPGIKSRKGLS